MLGFVQDWEGKVRLITGAVHQWVKVFIILLNITLGQKWPHQALTCGFEQANANFVV